MWWVGWQIISGFRYPQLTACGNNCCFRITGVSDNVLDAYNIRREFIGAGYSDSTNNDSWSVLRIKLLACDVGTNFSGSGSFFSGSASSLGFFPQLIRGGPQEASKDRQNRSEQYQQRVRNFESKPKKRRPEFGSLIVTVFTVISGIVAIGNSGRREWRLSLGLFEFPLILDGTFGFLFCFYLWSL